MRLLSERDLHAIVDPDLLIDASEDAFRMLSDGRAQIPPRTELQLPQGGTFFVMPGVVSDAYFGLKLIASRSDRDGPGTKTTSLILLIDAKTLSPLGMFSSDWFTDMRTAAGLAAATRRLALPSARSLAVYGTGKLADPTIRLLCRVRKFERVMIVGRNPARSEELCALLRQDNDFRNIAFDLDIDGDAAAAEADVIATVTSAERPVFDGRRVSPGVHINVAGAFRPDNREIDDSIAAAAFFYVDSLDACLARAGDIVIPLQNGALSRDRIRGEIGSMIAGQIPGRSSETEITVFKSLGNAVQDLHLGGIVLGAAGNKGIDFEPTDA